MLGPLEVRADSGDALEVGGTRLRRLLSMLALNPGRQVLASDLIEGLWGDGTFPADAANALQALVSRLRRAVPEAVIIARSAGYQLMIDPESTDIAQFERLASARRRQLRDDPVAASATLRAALALWRGPALADMAQTEVGEAATARLDELRLAATQDMVDADLRTGRWPGECW